MRRPASITRAAWTRRKLARHLKHSATRSGDKVSLRVVRDVMCGDHGVMPNTDDLCPTCGGYAQPWPNKELTRRQDQVQERDQKLD
jgi:hypothetical protein